MKTISEPRIAVVGATGVVGSEMLAILEERKIPYAEIIPLASAKSAGEIVEFDDQELVVSELNEDSFKNIDLALFAAGGSVSERFVPIAAEAGAIVIDNSSFFRMHQDVPLIVPEVNWSAYNDEKIIANPNCSTIQLMPVLAKIHELAGLKRVVVSTYQAVSGAGKAAMDELWDQTQGVYNQKEVEPKNFSAQIAFNCIPQIDIFSDDNYTKEELKVVNESRKILGQPELRITCTAVRVPVFNAHAESVNVETEQELLVADLIKALENTAGVTVSADPHAYPLQHQVSGQDDVFVGRIRKDNSVEHGLNLWVVADNLRKGAALNAVQILEKFVEQ